MPLCRHKGVIHPFIEKPVLFVDMVMFHPVLFSFSFHRLSSFCNFVYLLQFCCSLGAGLEGGIYLMLPEEVTRSRIYSSSCLLALHDKQAGFT